MAFFADGFATTDCILRVDSGRADGQDVITWSAVDKVSGSIHRCSDDVIAWASEHRVASKPRPQHLELSVHSAEKPIAAFAACENVTSPATYEDVRSRVEAGRVAIEAADRVTTLFPEEMVVPGAAYQIVAERPAIQLIIARLPLQGVVTVTSDDSVIPSPGPHMVFSSPGGDVVMACRADQMIFARSTHNLRRLCRRRREYPNQEGDGDGSDDAAHKRSPNFLPTQAIPSGRTDPPLRHREMSSRWPMRSRSDCGKLRDAASGVPARQSLSSVSFDAFALRRSGHQ